MPGMPFRRDLKLRIAKAGGWERVIERIADGETVAAIAREFKCSRSFFSRMLHEDEARSALAKAARVEAMDAWADEVKEIADNVPPERDHIQKAKLQIDSRLSLAASFAPETYGKKADAPQVHLTINQLHIDALRQRAAAEPLPVPRVALPVVEAEIEQPANEERT